MKTYGILIDGKWQPSSSGKTFDSINPSSEKSIGKFQQGNEKDVDRAVAAAKKAYESWRLMPPTERADILLEAALILQRDKTHYGELVSIEMGKQLKEGLSDVQEAIDTFKYFHGEGRRMFGHTTTSELQNKAAYTIRIPIGVCGLITPWNFPVAIPSWKLGPALVCGNTVVFKPSSDTPLNAIELVKVLEKAGIPKGVINLVTGPGSTVGKRLVEHPDVRMISFTGSKATGEWITKNAGVKKIGLELGSKNPIIVMDDANLDLAVEGTVWAAFGTTGQRCTAASRVIVHKKIQKAFEKKLVAAAQKLKIGNALTHEIGPLVNKRAQDKVQNYVDIGKKQKAKLLCGGKRGHGLFYPPTIFTEVTPKMTIAQEEIFGPVTAIMPVNNLTEAIKVANSVDYGLSSSIFTQDINNAMTAIRDLDFGITYINSSTIGSEVHLPFGGTKGTGNGTREAGWAGVEEFSENKTVYIDYSGKLQKAQMKDSGPRKK
ncbi:MAG: aldehyde dehydrogenase family protein [DPANN group archaeon]|nr:aldehyde dehydrogenase family protein [DPANN group archaeon]